MKKVSELVNGSPNDLNIQDDFINKISKEDIEKYAKIADKFISPEAKLIIEYLLVNNKDGKYLINFYKRGIPEEEDLKELFKNIGILKKKERLLEIPNFQTKEQFEGILNKRISPDEILLDLTTERGRNKIAKDYTPMVHKIAHQYNGKSNLSYDDLVEAGFEGLTWAMNDYGKKSRKQQRKEDKGGEELDLKKYKVYTFKSYVAFIISVHIREAIKNESRTVRLAVSQQKAQKKEQGYITRSNTVSGDRVVGKDKDGTGNKTVFDFIGKTTNGKTSLDHENEERLWNDLYKILDKEFADDPRALDIFYSFKGIHGYPKMKNKDLAEKYHLTNSNVTYYIYKVMSFLQHNKQAFSILQELKELIDECQNELDRESDDDEIQTINDSTIKEKLSFNDEDI